MLSIKQKSMEAGDKKELYRFIVWVLTFSICYIALKFSFGIIICDDAYITLSHVRTWIEHGRPLMSLKNPVNATSTPLFTILLTLLILVFGTDHLIIITYLTISFFEILTLVLVYRIAKKLQMPTSFTLLTVSVYGLSVGLYAMGTCGMETIVYLFLILLAHYLALFYHEKIFLISLVLFGVTLIRPEGVLVAGSVMVIRFINGEKIRVLLLYFAITFIALSAFSLFYYLSYGHILPHSVIAKRKQLDFGLIQAYRSWREYAFYKGPVFGGRRTIRLVNGVACIIGLWGFFFRKGIHKGLFLLIWPTLYIAFFLVTRSSDPLMPWYFFPIVPVCIIILLFGIYQLSNRLSVKPILIWVILFVFIAFCFVNTYIQKIPFKYRRSERV